MDFAALAFDVNYANDAAARQARWQATEREPTLLGGMERGAREKIQVLKERQNNGMPLCRRRRRRQRLSIKIPKNKTFSLSHFERKFKKQIVIS